MSQHFSCNNGQSILWKYVCDGYNHCLDDSDEENCYCQGDVYACLQGNNVSCKIACATYGRVTCLTYQNTRACEQYIQEQSTSTYLNISFISESFLLTKDFDALRYSACLAISILIFISLVSIIIYLIRKNPSQRLMSYVNKSFNNHLNRTPTERISPILQVQCPSLNLYTSNEISSPDLPPSYQYFDQISLSMSDFYDPPPYPGTSILSPVENPNIIHYETLKTRALSSSMSQIHPMLLPEPETPNNIRTYCV